MSSEPLPLQVWDRRAERLINEFMEDQPATYDSRPHQSVTQWFQSQPVFDWFIAALQNTRRSARHVQPFINKHKIDMTPFRPAVYRSFAEFFDREFKPEARRFPSASREMGAFAEARYFAWDRVADDQRFPIKGKSLRPADILASPEWAQPFLGGPVLLARLAPMDYHHVHYPDSGSTLRRHHVGGRLWTVNWHALLAQDDILFRNEREVQLLKTENFGRLAFVEIGAMSVGRIVQVHPLDQPYNRGAEKSLFKFGGSAIAVFGEPMKWRPSADLVQRTKDGIETLVQLGDTVAVAS